MALFLTILKIIGIVLLVILAVLLFIVLLVMFVPIRYRIDGHVEETNLETEADKLMERVYARAGFSWLLHFISGYIEFPEERQFTVKVLCFTVLPRKKKKKKGEDLEELDYEEDETAIESKEDAEGAESEAKEGEESEEAGESTESKDESGENTEESEDADKDSETESDSQNDHENDGNETSDNADISIDDDFDSEEDDKSFIEVLEDIWNKFIEILKVPQNVFEKIQCTISSIYAKIDMIKKTLENDIFKRAFKVTKKQLIRVLKMLRPTKCKADFVIGMSDPTVTADILAVYGILYPMLVKRFYLRPDFDRSVIGGELHIKGRVRVITVVTAAAIMFFKKDVRKTVRRFKKILKS